MTLTDNGEPGSADRVSFTSWSGSALLYSSYWGGAPPKTIEQVLSGTPRASRQTLANSSFLIPLAVARAVLSGPAASLDFHGREFA
jgi:hypothetical protein